MTQSNSIPAAETATELGTEEIDAVAGGTGYFGSGHRSGEGGGGTIGSGS